MVRVLCDGVGVMWMTKIETIEGSNSGGKRDILCALVIACQNYILSEMSTDTA